MGLVGSLSGRQDVINEGKWSLLAGLKTKIHDERQAMNQSGSPDDIDFSVDMDNLYREEGITDLKAASIRKLVPIKADGSDDSSRTAIFYGNTQLMTPDGPLPLQAELKANNLNEAYAEFPNAMRVALSAMIEKVQRMQQERNSQKSNDSRIIVPGM